MTGHDLGKCGSVESRERYACLVAEHASGTSVAAAPPERPDLTVAEIVLAYLRHAETYYRKNGAVTAEFACLKSAMRPLIALYADLPASQFGPLALKAVRQRMIDADGWSRRYINMSIGRIRRAFRWCVENELVEPAVLQRLEAVAPLMAGRSLTREHVPRSPVPEEAIERVKAVLPPRTADVMDLLLLTGARPGELMGLTAGMIDRSQDVWLAVLGDHKTAHRGKRRVLVFGPQAQAILTKYLPEDPNTRVFPVNRATVSDAIKRACLKLGLPVFTAHWLRHNAASRIRREFSLDAAQVMLGHSQADVTQLYAALNLDKAVEVARKSG